MMDQDGYPHLPYHHARYATVMPENSTNNQADQYTTGEEAAAKKASRSFKKYSYRGVELDQLLDLSNEKFIDVSVLSTGKDRAYLFFSSFRYLPISTFHAILHSTCQPSPHQ